MSNSGVIYFLRSGKSGPIKIGFTTSRAAFSRRVDCLQSGNPEELLVLATTDVPSAQARELESHLHRVFASARGRGEWFRPIEELLWLAERLARGFDLEGSILEARLKLSLRVASVRVGEAVQ